MRQHIAKTKERTWLRKGFLLEEAYYLSEISRAGAKAPYIQAMIRHRIALKAAARRYDWSVGEYRKRIVKDYEKFGLPKFKGGNYKQYIKKYLYDYFTEFKDRTPTDPTYESPKKKRRVRIRSGVKAQVTKRQMLGNKILELNDKISRAIMRGNQVQRRELEMQRNRYQAQLDNLR